ncbi:MAG: TlpA family protein disulfide reductase [Magnetospiraceae bacterium]
MLRHAVLGLLIAAFVSGTAAAQEQPKSFWVPTLTAAGKKDFARYKTAKGPKAFAIDPDGNHGMKVAGFSLGKAAEEALAACAETSQSPEYCTLFAANDDYVFHPANWPPEAGKPGWRDGRRAPEGTEVGARFPDLLYRTDRGREETIDSLRGKVAVVIFWNSRSGASRSSLGDLQRLANALDRDADRYAFIALQIGEDFKTSATWAKQAGIRLPLGDTGGDKDEPTVEYSDGAVLPASSIVETIPSAFVLDTKGRVAKSYTGATRWVGERRFLEQLADQ